MNHSIFRTAKVVLFSSVAIYFQQKLSLCYSPIFVSLPHKQKLMVQIDDVIVSLDVFREKFLCDLHACKGECCIEGDAGAPVELEEVEKLEEVLPVIWDDLAPEAQEVIKRQGVVYTDEEGDLVTSIVNGKTAYLPATMRKAIVIVPSKSIPGREMQLLQTDFLPPVSDTHRRLRPV